MQDRYDKQCAEQKGQRIGHAVLVIDRRQQHDQQGDREGHPGSTWQDENPSLV